MHEQAYPLQDPQLELLGLGDEAFLRAGFDAACSIELHTAFGCEVDLAAVGRTLVAWIGEAGERWAREALRRETEAELLENGDDDEAKEALAAAVFRGMEERAVLRPLAQDLAAQA
ncbi:MAG: hypothetical protein ACREJR_04195 [Candidatus Rokuibacteriota bacterium]